jgi:MoxR-like ATPase
LRAGIREAPESVKQIETAGDPQNYRHNQHAVARKQVSTEATAADVRALAQQLSERIEQVIVGKGATVKLLLVALLTGGHVLLEDVPGVGKTTLARATARCLGCSFSRIQCTPDLLPSDVVGVHVFNQANSQFEFHPGPIMANVILVDEINRATPRTQSALLESMQEHQITVDTTTLPLPRPFLLIATQNPIEMAGTYLLPEAQLDRFLLRLTLGYPSEDEEGLMVRQNSRGSRLDSLDTVLTGEELLQLQVRCRDVHVTPDVEGYLVKLVRTTRHEARIDVGASPRATLALYTAAQSLAAIRGRAFVLPDDVKELALPVLGHRLILKSEERLRGGSAEQVLTDVIKHIPAPVVPER